jgi:protein-S-isoprenylcysteine O-methyltransferase Ste14
MPTALFLYYLLFFAAAFAWPTWRVWKRHGVNPLVLPRDDSAYGLIGAWFNVLLLGLFAMLGGLAFGVPQRLLAPLDWLSLRPVEIGGWAVLTISTVWIVAAQLQMGRSWRIGIDTREQPPLVKAGLFRLSRNPIFLGMRANLLGLFMVLPNAVTLAALLIGEVLMQVQVRLEEQHLSAALGDAYKTYALRVPRWA